MPTFTYCGPEPRYYPHVLPDGPGLDAEPGEDYELPSMPDDGLWHTPGSKAAKEAKKHAPDQPATPSEES